MSAKRFAILLVLVLATGLPLQVASAEQAPPARLTYDGVLDLPHLPSGAAAHDAPPTLLAPEYASWSRLVFQSARNERDWEIYGAGGDGSDQVNLSNNANADLHPRLNRGATQVIFASNRRDNIRDLHHERRRRRPNPVDQERCR